MTMYFGQHDSGSGRYDFGRDDFRATWPVTRSTSAFKTWGVLNNLKFYTGRLRLEVQPLPLYKLYISTILYRKGTPLIS